MIGIPVHNPVTNLKKKKQLVHKGNLNPTDSRSWGGQTSGMVVRLVINTEDFAESTDSQSFIIISFQGSHVSKGGVPLVCSRFHWRGGVNSGKPYMEAVHLLFSLIITFL